MNQNCADTLDLLSDAELAAEYRKWIAELDRRRTAAPMKKLMPSVNAERLAHELQAGGVGLPPDLTTMVRYREKVITIEVPTAVAASYPMAEVMQHVNFLIVMARAHCPKRARVIADEGVFRLVEI